MQCTSQGFNVRQGHLLSIIDDLLGFGKDRENVLLRQLVDSGVLATLECTCCGQTVGVKVLSSSRALMKYIGSYLWL